MNLLVKKYLSGISSLFILLGMISFTTQVDASPVNQNLIRSTVLIGIYDQKGQLVGRASGVIVSEQGTIITNRHVVEGEDGNLMGSLIVVPTNGNEEPDWPCAWRPSLVTRHPQRDMAVLFTQTFSDIPCKLSHVNISSSIPETGTNIQILGYPAIDVGSLSITLTNGQIAGRITENGYVSELKTDAKIIKGVSGGPVFDSGGSFIGIATAYTGSSSEFIGFITPALHALDLIGTNKSIPKIQPIKPIEVEPKNEQQTNLISQPNYQYSVPKNFKNIYSDVPERGCSELLNVKGEYYKDELFENENFHIGSRVACERSRALTLLKGKEIMTGYPDGFFRPSEKINRAEFAKIVIQAFQVTPNTDQYHDCFPDVTTQWFAKFVCFAKEKGWVSGYSDGLFRPEQQVSNMEALKILLAPNYDVLAHQESNYQFVSEKEWYANYLKTTLDLNLVNVEEWSSRWFDYQGQIDRETIAMILYKFYLVKNKNLEKYRFHVID